MYPFLIYVLIINILCFLTFALDKGLSKVHRTRISEKTLLTLTFVGGSLGGLISMTIFKHKISKVHFLLRFFGIMIAQTFILVLFVKYLNLFI
ncbi:MAG: DUF1294 domain-containing protein [Flavobacterium sp.]